MLADTLRLGEDTPPADPFAAWSPPSVLPDPTRVKRVIAELERGLQPTRPEFLKWICDKLSALPTQTASATNAALWSDNVIDVCAEYPEDLLQSACLELLKTRTFRPSPAEIVKAIEAKHGERKRMLARARKLLPEAPKAAAPAEQEPDDVRLRAAVRRYLDLPAGSFLKPILQRSAVAAEKRLAEIENRNVADWARSVSAPQPIVVAQETREREFTPDTSPSGRRLAALAESRRSGKPLPEWRDEPMGEEAAA